MTIQECKDREKKFKNLHEHIHTVISEDPPVDRTYVAPDMGYLTYEDYDLILLALARSMAIEELNIADLKEKENATVKKDSYYGGDVFDEDDDYEDELFE